MPILIEEMWIDHKLDWHLHKHITENMDELMVTTPGLIYVKDGTPENIAYSINEYFHRYNKKIIALGDYKEAPNSHFLYLQNEIIKLLLNKYGFNKDQIVYISGFLPTEENFIKLDNLYKQHDLIPVEIINYAFFEHEWSFLSNSFPNVPPVRTKQNYRNKTRHFLYFTGAPRVQRWIMLAKLIESKLIEKTHFSVFENKAVILDNIIGAIRRSKNPDLSKLLDKTLNTIMKSPYDYPVVLSCSPSEPRQQHMINDGDADLFLDTHVSIISETSYFKKFSMSTENFWNFHEDFTFLTEKTFRAIAMLHPFILMARPHTLSALRQLGYKTFHPYIDENYDTIEDDVKRLEAVYSSIEKLSKMTEKQWDQFERNIFPIVIYNKEVMKKVKHRPVWMSSVLDKYSDARNNNNS